MWRNQFHKVIIRARCEKTDFEKSGLIVEIPRIHESEFHNRTVLNKLGVENPRELRGVKK